MDVAKIILSILFCLNMQIAMPMEKQLWQNASQLDVCDLLTNASMPIEQQLMLNTSRKWSIAQEDKDAFLTVFNNMNLGLLVMQAMQCAWLKKNNCLFGAELIPRNFHIPHTNVTPNTKGTMVWTIMVGLLVCDVLSIIDVMLFEKCTFSSPTSDLIKILPLVVSLVHLANFTYDSALEQLKKARKKSHDLKILIKNNLDSTKSPCVICAEEPTDEQHVNPCEQKDHVFCASCLTKCLNMQNNKSDLADKRSFLCELCRKDIPFDDTKFEVLFPDKLKITLQLWAQQLDIFDTVFYGMPLAFLALLLRCQF